MDCSVSLAALATRLQITRPLVALDFESTGTSPESDRIVQIGLLRASPPHPVTVQRFVSYVNPGIPIPAAATAAHHITDAMVAGAPTWQALAPRFCETVHDCDFLGYRVMKFDLPLVQAECARIGVPWLLPLDAHVIDGLSIYFEKDPRDLTSALRRFGGAEASQAHDAGADAESAVIVVNGQLDAFPDLPLTVPGLGAFCFPDPRITSDGKIVWKGTDPVLSFGRWRDVPLPRVPTGYLQFMIKSTSGFTEDTKAVIRRCLGGNFPVRTP